VKKSWGKFCQFRKASYICTNKQTQINMDLGDISGNIIKLSFGRRLKIVDITNNTVRYEALDTGMIFYGNKDILQNNIESGFWQLQGKITED
jgi:hypothetical protein